MEILLEASCLVVSQCPAPRSIPYQGQLTASLIRVALTNGETVDPLYAPNGFSYSILNGPGNQKDISIDCAIDSISIGIVSSGSSSNCSATEFPGPNSYPIEISSTTSSNCEYLDGGCSDATSFNALNLSNNPISGTLVVGGTETIDSSAGNYQESFSGSSSVTIPTTFSGGAAISVPLSISDCAASASFSVSIVNSMGQTISNTASGYDSFIIPLPQSFGVGPNQGYKLENDQSKTNASNPVRICFSLSWFCLPVSKNNSGVAGAFIAFTSNNCVSAITSTDVFLGILCLIVLL